MAATAVTKTTQFSAPFDIFHSILITHATLLGRYGAGKTKYLKFEPAGELGVPGYPYVVIKRPLVSTDHRNFQNLRDKGYAMKIEFVHDYSAADKMAEDVDACITHLEQNQSNLQAFGVDDVEVIAETSEVPELRGDRLVVVGEMTVNYTVDLDVE